MTIDIQQLVENAFRKERIPFQRVDVRRYPGEAIVVVEVSDCFDEAVALANRLDPDIEDGFITVRRSKLTEESDTPARVSSVTDSRVTALIELLNSRSRTSESQPSLRYVEDAAKRIRVATSTRHNLIFGRRGVGKTALMLEAKRIVEQVGGATVWVNMQTLRELGPKLAFLTVAMRLCEIPALRFAGRRSTPKSVTDAEALSTRIEQQLNRRCVDRRVVKRLVPQLQQMLRLFCEEAQSDIFVFLDDLHYLPADDVPHFLDFVHGATRDVPVWIKAAAIRHQTRWFIPNPPIGLQLDHDATGINLDITLEEPERARAFLAAVLSGYVDECGIASTSGFLAGSSLGRLVLASGGVPRDFLTLCASAIQVARKRAGAKKAGVQDVNTAAGLAAKSKVEELESDAAAARGNAEEVLDAFNKIKAFLLEDQQTTFLRIDFKDKEKNQTEYGYVQSLMDLRMLHLLQPSLSARHEAGRRFEVYMLDLSQYSGRRLKRNLSVLDFEQDFLVLKKTRSGTPAKPGDTPRRLITILRGGPQFELSLLRE